MKIIQSQFKIILILLLLQFLLPKQSNGQNTFARRLNLNIIDLVSINPLEDSTILITSFDPLNPGITEIIKYDKMNGSIWSKTIQFQDSITIHQTFDQITTKDNNYIFFAWQGNDHCSIIKYDSSANVIWAESIASGWSRNAFFSPTQDSGFVMTLKLDSVVGQNYFELKIMKFNKNGVIEWGKVMQDSITALHSTTQNTIIQTDDHGYLIALFDNEFSAQYVLICKLDSSGNYIRSTKLFLINYTKLKFERINSNLFLLNGTQDIVYIDSTGYPFKSKVFMPHQIQRKSDSTFLCISGPYGGPWDNIGFYVIDTSGNFLNARNYNFNSNTFFRGFCSFQNNESYLATTYDPSQMGLYSFLLIKTDTGYNMDCSNNIWGIPPLADGFDSVSSAAVNFIPYQTNVVPIACFTTYVGIGPGIGLDICSTTTVEHLKDDVEKCFTLVGNEIIIQDDFINKEVNVFDTSGRLLVKGKGQNRIEMENGIYLIQFIGASKNLFFKVVVAGN